MSETLHKMQVIIEGNNSKLKQAAKEAQQSVNKMTTAINDSMKGIKSPVESMKNNNSMQQLRNMQDLIKSSFRDMKSGAIPGTIVDGVKNYVKEAQLAAGIKVRTKDWQKNEEDIKRSEAAVERLKQKERDMKASGAKKNSDEYQKLAVQIRSAERALGSYIGRKRYLEGTGKDVQFSGGIANRSIGASVEASIGQIPAMIRQVNASVMEAIQRIPIIGRVASEAAYIGSKAFKGMRAVLTGIGPAIKKTSGVFGSLIKKFTSGIPIIRRFTGGIHNSNNAFGGGIGKLLKYGLGIRSLYVLFNRLRSAMVDGFKNLSKHSSTTNANISTLKSGLSQLKNSFATAFAPILNIVTPILSTLIDYLVTACNAVGQFFAALTGQSTYTTAKRVQQDYASSLGDTADAASSAAEQVKRSLMGFDEINKLDDSSGGGSGGSGGSGGGASGMFQDQTVTNQFANFAQMIKDAWNNADFTEIGRIAGEKINAALENIPWDKIKNTCNKIAKSVATFLNGFIEGTDWDLVGKTIAEGINTAIGMFNTFATTFKWDELGDAIASGINGAIKNVDWAQIGQTISEYAKGILTTFNKSIQETDWRQLGESIKTGIVSVDWSGIISGAAEAVGSIAGAATALVVGLFGDIPGAIHDYFMEKKEECGGSLVKGIFEGIKDALLNVGSWIKENMLDPIVTGFKNAFGIHSPSTVFEELGKYCIEGFFNGLKNIPAGIADLAKKIWEGLKTAWDNLGEITLSIGAKIETTGQKLWAFVSNAWETVKNNTVVANVSAALKGGWDIVNSTLESLKKQAKNVTYTFKAKAEGAWKTLKGYVSSVVNKIKDKTANYTANARGAWDKVKSYVSSFAREIKDRSATYGARATGDWGGIARNAQILYDSVKSKTATFRANATGAWDKISGVLDKARQWLINKTISWTIKLSQIKLPSISVNWKDAVWKGQKLFSYPTLDLSWKYYAKGGFPGTGEMFVANEEGPELVGKMGKRTTVANQQQIVSGIKTGVYEAVMAAFAYFSGSERKQTPVFNIYVGGKKVTDVVIEEVNNRTKATGKCPILT